MSSILDGVDFTQLQGWMTDEVVSQEPFHVCNFHRNRSPWSAHSQGFLCTPLKERSAYNHWAKFLRLWSLKVRELFIPWFWNTGVVIQLLILWWCQFVWVWSIAHFIRITGCLLKGRPPGSHENLLKQPLQRRQAGLRNPRFSWASPLIQRHIASWEALSYDLKQLTFLLLQLAFIINAVV